MKTFPDKKTTIRNYFNRSSQKKYDQNHISTNFDPILKTIFDSSLLNRYLSKKKISIIDVGAGSCDFETILFTKRKFTDNDVVVALDFSKSMVEKCMRKTMYNIHPLVSDATSLALRNNCSDITIFLNVLPYIENVENAMSELFRITKKNGIIIIVKPIRDQYGFWEDQFENIEINYHDNFKECIQSNMFKVLEMSDVAIYPIDEVDCIKVPIAELLILGVIK
jgi:ubiquinone/menaquinone biosynthesis C-methylase UbiE